jgi:hypothetical protein
MWMQSHDMSFMLKLKRDVVTDEQSASSEQSDLFCYVLFRDHPATLCFDEIVPANSGQQPTAASSDVSLSSSGGQQKARGRFALVLLSQWLFPQLAYQALSVLADALVWSACSTVPANVTNTKADGVNAVEYSLVGNSDDSSGTLRYLNHSDDVLVKVLCLFCAGLAAAISSLMMAGFSQVVTWPAPTANALLYVPYFGQVRHCNCDIVAEITIWSPSDDSHLQMLPYSVPTDNRRPQPVNLVSMLGPVGLLQHLWIIWEFLITGIATRCSRL